MSEENKLNDPCPFCQSRACCYVLAGRSLPEQVKAQEQQFRLSVAKLVEAAREANEKFKIWNGGTGMERITEALKPFPKEPTEKERSGEDTTNGR